MSYADKTFKDRNPIKRFFQKSRLNDALSMIPEALSPKSIVDFGAGNGELCKQLVKRFPDARIICYEPHPELLQQARENIGDLPATVTDEVPSSKADMVFCLEVLEHLPDVEFEKVLSQIHKLLIDDGVVIFGVPIETGFPALYKGLFRMTRRYGDFDARPLHILNAWVGRPPTPRPVVELMPESWYHLDHLGFDHRTLDQRLGKLFRIVKVSTSPFPVLGTFLNSEINFLATPKEPGY